MSEKEILRNQARRLGVIRQPEEVSKNISKTCRYFGVAGQPFTDGAIDIKNMESTA